MWLFHHQSEILKATSFMIKGSSEVGCVDWPYRTETIWKRWKDNVGGQILQ